MPPSDLWPEDLVKRFKTRNLELRSYWYESHCRNCIGTDLQKRRECPLLDGYDLPGCQAMDRFVAKNMKDISEESLANALQFLDAFKESRK